MWLDGGQTAEGCVHEDWLAFVAEHNFMGVDIPGGEAGSGYIEAITALMEQAWSEQVVEAPELVTGGHPEAFAINKQAHRPIKQPFVQFELSWLGCVGSEEQQSVSAVCGESQCDAGAAKPIG